MTTNFGGVDVVALQGAMVEGVTTNSGGRGVQKKCFCYLRSMLV